MTNLPDRPRPSETQETYVARLNGEGFRELYIRKALRTHFSLSIEQVIEACNQAPQARELEIRKLRETFPNLNENRLAWRISRSLTIPKEDALTWSQTILAGEEGQG
jgi:hypothetical protein